MRRTTQFVLFLCLFLVGGGNFCDIWGQINISNAIVNPSFEEGMKGWTSYGYNPEGNEGLVTVTPQPRSDLSITNKDGKYLCDYYANRWTGWWSYYVVYQTIEDMPRGTYVLTAMVSTHEDKFVTLFAGQAGGALNSGDSKVYANQDTIRGRGADNGLYLSLRFTLTAEKTNVVIGAGLVNTHSVPEIFFRADNFQLFYYGAKVEDKLENPSFESCTGSSATSQKTVQPAVASDANKNRVTGWTVTSTDPTNVYYGVIANSGTNSYNGYSKLSGFSAQEGTRALLVRHGENNNGNSLSLSNENELPTSGNFIQEATITLKTTSKVLTSGHYLCSVRCKLADYGGGHARVGLSAAPQYGRGSDTGLLWGKTTWHNAHVSQTQYGLFNSYNLHMASWAHPLAENGTSIDNGKTKEWITIATDFEVIKDGVVDIIIELCFPADDKATRENTSSITITSKKWYYVYGTEALIDNVTIESMTPVLNPGEYYLYNETTGQYLGSHAGANYGSQAMTDDVGLNLNFTTRSDGTTIVNTEISNGGNKYLGVDGSVYCDRPSNSLTLHAASSTLYYLSSGDNFITSDGIGRALKLEKSPTDASMWRLKTYGQRVRELQEMSAGDEAVDATFLIQNPDFGRYDTRWANWVTEANGSAQVYGEYNNSGMSSGASEYRRGGNINNYIVENWHHAPHVYQNISSRDASIDLPSGVYELTVQGFDGENGTSSQLYIKDSNYTEFENSVELPKLATLGKSFADGAFASGAISDWFTSDRLNAQTSVKTYVFGEPSAQTPSVIGGSMYPAQFSVGVRNTGYDQWTVFDNFQLKYRPFSAIDVSTESANTVQLKADANIKNKGTGAFQVNTATEPHLVALDDAVSAASGGVTKDDFRDNVLSLKRAQAAFLDALPYLVVNEPDVSKYYRIKNVTDTYGKKNNVLTFKSSKNADLTKNTTKMGWSEAEGSIYPQMVTFTKVPEVDCTSKVTDSWSFDYGEHWQKPNINGVSMTELYGSSSAGTKISQEITGLAPGLYRAELYALSHNARGEDGALLNGERSGVAYVFATGNGKTRKTYFTARGIVDHGVSGEPETPVIEDIEVGADGKMTLGLGLETSNLTGWHAIEIKSLTKVSYNDYTLSYTRADGKVVYVGTGTTTGLGDDTKSLRPTKEASKALSVRIDSQSNQDGQWWLRNTECSNQRIGANGKDDEGFFTGEANGYSYYDMELAELTAKPSATVSVSDKYKYSTLMLPFDAELPEGVTAYTVQGTLSDKTIALTEVGRNIKANVPYVLHSEDGCSGELVEGFGKAYTDDTQSDEQLTGTFFEETVYVPKDGYVLSVKEYCGEEVTAFYRVTEANSVRLPKYRAYYTHKDITLDSPSPAPAKASFYPFTILNQDITPADIITLVNTILKKEQENAPRYIQRADGRVMYTDVNGDGEVTLADVTALVNLMNKNR